MGKKISDFYAFNDVQSQNYLAAFVPKGKLTARRFDNTSNIYKLIYCIADFIKQVTGQIFQLAYNRDTTQVNELMNEWEDSLGIPLSIPRQSTLSARRFAIGQLISKIPVINYEPAGFSGDLRTTVENYVLNLTGIIIHIVFTPSAVTGSITISYDNSTGLVTCTTSSTTGIAIGALVTVSGCAQAALNGTHTVNVLSSTQFTFTVAAGLTLSNDSGTFLALLGFPYTFPLTFGVPYNQSLLLWNIQVVGVSLPQSTIQLLNVILSRVIPSFSAWTYSLVAH